MSIPFFLHGAFDTHYRLGLTPQTLPALLWRIVAWRVSVPLRSPLVIPSHIPYPVPVRVEQGVSALKRRSGRQPLDVCSSPVQDAENLLGGVVVERGVIAVDRDGDFHAPPS